MKAIHAGPLSRWEPPTDIDSKKRVRHQFHAQIRFIKAIDIKIQRLMTLVVKREIVFVAQKSIRKVAINAKAMTRGKLPRKIHVSAIDIVTKFRNTAKQHATFGSTYQGNGLAGMGQKRQSKRTSKKYFQRKVSIHSNMATI